MKTQIILKSYKVFRLLLLVVFLLPLSVEAQRMNHKAGGGGGRPAVSRPAAKPKGAINGGNKSTAARNKPAVNKPAVKKPVVNKPAVNKSSGDNKLNVNAGNKNSGNSGNKPNISTGNKNKGSGNKIDIDNSKKNVNINVDNSKDIKINNNRNTVVRHNNRPYGRPPYVYGGFRYNCYHPYHYHPYRPFMWGPMWHPWGFFITTLAATAIIVSVENQQYHYDQGVYYIQSDGGYTVVQAPVSATITTLPSNSQTVVVNETTNNYYYGGTYYEKSDGGYTVVPPTAGTVVENLPEGGEEVKIGDVTYVKFGETYYQPFEQDGKNMYEVVQIEEGEQ